MGANTSKNPESSCQECFSFSITGKAHATISILQPIHGHPLKGTASHGINDAAIVVFLFRRLLVAEHWRVLGLILCLLPSFFASLPSLLPFFLPPSFLSLGFGLARLHSAQLGFTLLSLARLHSASFGLASLCSAWLGSAWLLVFGKLSPPLLP